MARILLLLLALAVLVVIALVYMGRIDVTQTRQAQTPAFDVDVRPVEVGTTTRNVQVPVVRMENRQVEVPAIGREANEPGPAQAPVVNGQ